MRILIYDTTLRDGTQGENINFTAEEKLKVARKLDELGFDYVEGGWPGSNPRDKEFFRLAKKEKFKNAKLTAFGSTCRKKTKPQDDLNIQELVKAKTPAVAIFGKTWDLHVEKVMRNTLKENLRMIYDSVSYLKSKGREVVYDAEHFFDGYKTNPEYALKTLKTAQEAGADFLVLCDTNGGSLTHEIEEIVKLVKKELGVLAKLGIHTHNDSGLAVANSLSAVRAGCVMVQGTINGYGERCGNADLTSIIPNLELKMNYECLPKSSLKNLKSLSMFVSEMANAIPQHSRPFVGKSAFAHKGGIHVSAVMREGRAYEHLKPELVGNERRVLVSDLAGKSNIEYKAKEMNLVLGENGESVEIVKKVKDLEQLGYQFDVAPESFELWLRKFNKKFKPAFELVKFKVFTDKNEKNNCASSAIVKLKVKDKEVMSASEGDGPVHALDNAMRKALKKFFPKIEKMALVDFKVRVINGQAGTGARVRVLVESRDEKKLWTTVGVSEDVLEASWQALEDSFQYYLTSV